MHLPRLAFVAALAAAAPSASAQTVLFEDDFDGGLAAWSATGLWRELQETQSCAENVAPFPSSPACAAFNRYEPAGYCGFEGDSFGELTLLAPVSIPAGASSARLRFASFERTECGAGNCAWDHRYVEVSTDLGQQWTTLAEGAMEGFWNVRYVPLDAYRGQDVLVRFRFDAIDPWDNAHLGWLVDDVVIEADPVGVSYCKGKRGSAGCVPYVLASGDPSLSGPDDLVVTADLLVSNVISKLVWSRGKALTPFHGGTLCVETPAARTTPAPSGGTPGARDCTGGYSWSFSHAYLASKAVLAGEKLYVQASTRDPGFPAPFNHGLSNAVAITILP